MADTLAGNADAIAAKLAFFQTKAMGLSNFDPNHHRKVAEQLIAFRDAVEEGLK